MRGKQELVGGQETDAGQEINVDVWQAGGW